MAKHPAYIRHMALDEGTLEVRILPGVPTLRIYPMDRYTQVILTIIAVMLTIQTVGSASAYSNGTIKVAICNFNSPSNCVMPEGTRYYGN